MTRSLLLAACVLSLGGCADQLPQTNKAPAALITLRRDVVVPLAAERPNGPTAQWWRQQAGIVAEGDLRAVHADIVAARPAEADALRRNLISSGIDPERISASARFAKPGRRPTVVFTRIVAALADCSAPVPRTNPPVPFGDLVDSGRCAQDRALAAMVVDPADLAVPGRLGEADGAYLANGIRAWRDQGTTSGGTAKPSAAPTTGQ
jgi:type IV pilus biogenesis protein CpaD/CtpE